MGNSRSVLAFLFVNRGGLFLLRFACCCHAGILIVLATCSVAITDLAVLVHLAVAELVQQVAEKLLPLAFTH